MELLSTFRRAGVLGVVCLLCFAATAAAARPQPQESRAVEITSGGKVLVAGTAGSGVFVARYLHDGRIDGTFGGGDGVTVIGGRASSLGGLGVQSDGRIVVASNYLSEAEPSALSRLTASGQVDESFGTDGTATFAGSGFTSGGTGNGLSIDSSDRILVAGTQYLGETPATATARFLPDGEPDQGFGIDGVAAVDQSDIDFYGETATAIIADGADILAMGARRAGPSGGSFFFAKFAAEGDVDPTFGVGGIARGAAIEPAFEARDMAVNPNGSMIAVGSLPTRDLQGGCDNFILTKVDSGGHLDSDFGTNGLSGNSPPDCEGGSSVALTDGNRILVTGPVYRPSIHPKRTPRVVVARFRANGARDTSFGQGGMAVHRLRQGPSGTSALAVTPSGSILAAGWFEPGGRTPLLVKLKANGGIQTAFGRDGVAKRLRDSAP